MDYTKFSTPFMSYAAISRVAEKFRNKYQSEGGNPLKIFDIIEFDFGIDIIPSPNLQARCGADAFITSSWKEMYVDKKQYENEANKRINFSVSHEIAHFILHRKIYADLGIKSVEDLYRFIEESPNEEYSRMEWQANDFAGKILVPKDDLEKAIEDVTNRVLREELSPELFLQELSEIFNVNGGVISIRMTNERMQLDERLRDYFS